MAEDDHLPVVRPRSEPVRSRRVLRQRVSRYACRTGARCALRTIRRPSVAKKSPSSSLCSVSRSSG